MKIILFTPVLSEGGAQQVAFLLASALLENGHEIIIATPLAIGELAENFRKKCRVVDFGTGKPIKSTKSISRLIMDFSADAIICFGIYAGIAAALSKMVFRWKPPIFMRNENNLHLDWQQASFVNRLIGPVLSRWAARHSHVIAVSRALASATANYLHIDSSHVTTILNPVIDDAAVPVETESTKLHPWLADASVPVFVAMGRLENQKGFDVLIDAFAKIKEKTNARLVIFGSGSLRDVLQAQIDSSNMGGAIVLAGHTDCPIAQMRRACAFVLSSRFEGFGLVLVEALWAGTLVISTDCDYGPAEVLEGGRYGTLVPVEDRDALANAMLDVLQQPRSIQRPPDTWFEKFTATEAARQHVALIESVKRGLQARLTN